MTSTDVVDQARTRWAVRGLWTLVAFQLLIALLAYLDHDAFVSGMLGSALGPNRDAAEGSWLGSIAVHLVLAVSFAIGAVRLPRGRLGTRIRLTVPLLVTAVVGVAALWLPVQTYLTPIGVVLAVAVLVLIWLPARR